MLRLIFNISRNFSSSVSVIQHHLGTKPLRKISCYHKFIKPNICQHHRYLTAKATDSDLEISSSEPNNSKPSSLPVQEQNPFDSDEYLLSSEDIVKKELTKVSKSQALDEFRNAYNLSDKQAQDIFTAEVRLKKGSFQYFLQTLKLLLKYFTKQTVLENPWIITVRPKLLQTKIDILQTIKPRDINDFVPFLRMSAPRLGKLSLYLKRDSSNLPNNYENRIYYISDRLGLDPKLVSKHLSKRLFILYMPWESLEQNLNNMINYGVEPISILKDLWAFRYTPNSVKARLERAKDAQKDKIMPWMVRCPERILQRTLKISMDEKKLLGDMDSNVEYVSFRLGYDIESTKAIMYRHPAVMRVRVPKVKKVLDYLLNDAQFEPYEIAQVPRILCHSLETTRRRFEELKSLGCKPSTLVILCRTRREYKKFVENWSAIHEKIKNKKNVGISNDF